MAIFCKNFVQTESQKYQNYAFIFWMILIKIQTTMILSWKCEHIIIRQKSFAECQKSKQPIIQYLKCWEDKTKKSYNITLKSKTSTPPPFLNSRYPPLLYFCSVFPVDDWDWASPGTSSLCGCTSVGAAEAGQC